MNQYILMICDATFGAGSENFGTVTGNVTFQDGSANSGTINGNATFQGTTIHRAGAVVTGDATFSASATNSGTVSGTVTVEGYAAWLAGNTGVNQFSNGQWAYNSTEYGSQAEAQAAYNAANVNHPNNFPGTEYWADTSSFTNGDVFYVGQHSSVTANYVSFYYQDYLIETDGGGVVRVTPPA